MPVSRVKFAVGWLLALAACQGCSTLSEYQSEWALKHRAHQVYKSAASGVPPGPLARHYERGWKRGYCDVAEGGNGAPPPLPPEAYWSFKYQNPEGQIAIETWFEAYQDGAQMALADGVQQFNYLPSPHLREPAYQPAYQPEYQPAHQLEYQPLGEPLYQPLNEPLNEPLDKPLAKPLDDSLIKPLDKQLDQSLDQPLNKPWAEPDSPLTAPPRIRDEIVPPPFSDDPAPLPPANRGADLSPSPSPSVALPAHGEPARPLLDMPTRLADEIAPPSFSDDPAPLPPAIRGAHLSPSASAAPSPTAQPQWRPARASTATSP